MFLVYHRLKVWVGLIRCFGAYFFGTVSLPGAVDTCSPRPGGHMIVSVVMCGEYHTPITYHPAAPSSQETRNHRRGRFCANMAEKSLSDRTLTGGAGAHQPTNRLRLTTTPPHVTIFLK